MKNCYKHFEKQTWKNNSKLSEKEDSRIKKKKKKNQTQIFCISRKQRKQ